MVTTPAAAAAINILVVGGGFNPLQQQLGLPTEGFPLPPTTVGNSGWLGIAATATQYVSMNRLCAAFATKPMMKVFSNSLHPMSWQPPPQQQFEISTGGGVNPSPPQQQQAFWNWGGGYPFSPQQQQWNFWAGGLTPPHCRSSWRGGR